MNYINGITAQSAQITGLTLEDGSVAQLAIYFRPQQNGWFFDVTWPGSDKFPVPFVCLGRRLVTSANLLRQFREVIPFGIGCFTISGADPMTLTCFFDGTAVLTMLGAADVAAAEVAVFTP